MSTGLPTNVREGVSGVVITITIRVMVKKEVKERKMRVVMEMVVKLKEMV